MTDYWDIVCNQRDKCVMLKRELACPLQNVIFEYSQVFFELCGNIGEHRDKNGQMETGNWRT